MKRFNKMNNLSKYFVLIVCLGLMLTGVVYATTYFVKKLNKTNKDSILITPIFTSKISTINANEIWVGSFNLVWNEFMEKEIGGNIEFENEFSQLANELNKKAFKKEDISKNSYYTAYGRANYELKEEIQNSIKEKFNDKSIIINKVNWDNPNACILYAILNKKFSYLIPFETLNEDYFNGSNEKVKYFGLVPGRPYTAKDNIEVLFYNSNNDFAVKLNTQEGDEVVLYKTNGENMTFEENYNELIKKAKVYSGDKLFLDNDILKIPFICLDGEINYDELCGKIIKGTNLYIQQAIQTINFELNNYGGSVSSESLITIVRDYKEPDRKFEFTSDFILYLKEKDNNKFYFALKVANTDVLDISDY